VVACVRTREIMDTLVRLEELGMARAPLGKALRGVAVQTLVRRLCGRCARSADDPAGIDVQRPVGCDHCAGTGFRGVLPLANVATITADAGEMIARGTPWPELAATAFAGHAGGLLADGLRHVQNGHTTIEEVDRAIHAPGARVPGSGKRPLVLVADDDTVTRILARSLLEQDGHRVVEAMDGMQAIERIGDGEDVRLVILDLHMPRLDGRQALKRLKSNVRTAGLPVIVLTGSSNPADEILVIDEGAEDYIRKPIDPPRFLARVHAALRRHASAAGGVS
jgi:CheY-like chemotaxis protein